MKILFIFLLITYVLGILGNWTIIMLSFIDSHFKIRMYFISEISQPWNSHSQVFMFPDSPIACQLVIIPLFTMLVLLKYFCHNFFSWVPCHMIILWLNVHPCIMCPSWTKGSVLSLSLALGWLICCCVHSAWCGLPGRILWPTVIDHSGSDVSSLLKTSC